MMSHRQHVISHGQHVMSLRQQVMSDTYILIGRSHMYNCDYKLMNVIRVC